MTERDAHVLLLHWNDGSHAVFFESDAAALESYVNNKVRRDGPEAVAYKTSRLTKGEYDHIKGL